MISRIPPLYPNPPFVRVEGVIRTTPGTLLQFRAMRKRAIIQNLAITPVYVLIGGQEADPGQFSVILPACAVLNDGTSPPFVIDLCPEQITVAAVTGNVRVVVTDFN